eukprot:c39529_g1_i1 orf=124-300(+)
MIKKGIFKWQHLWDTTRGCWWLGEVLRRRHKLSDKETVVIKEIIQSTPDWFPMNVMLG